ncbi:MAG: nucleotidyltransferase domain-containing protein [Rubrivivax sp.]
MHPFVESKRSEVAELCRRSGVRRLEVFGSAARGDFDAARSDIDFLVELEDDPRVSPLDAYFELKDALEAVFGRPVDLVTAASVRNPYVKAGIERDRELLYLQ